MALTISQISAASYPAVLAVKRKAENQWTDNTAMQTMEDKGFVKRVPGGPTIEIPVDYQANQGAAFQDFALDPLAMGATEFLTALSYTPAQLSVPAVWKRSDEVQNSTENQKIAFVKNLHENAINSHDDKIERAIFATSTNGFLGLLTIVPTSGQGTVGGVSAATETWHRNQTGTYLDDGTDMQAQLGAVYNLAAKGSGSESVPKLIIADGATFNLFEGTQAALQRWNDTQTMKAGALKLMFKTAQWEFSQFASTSIWMLSPKSVKLVFFNGAFRDKDEDMPTPGAQGRYFTLFTMGQLVAVNKSRAGVLTVTAS